MGQCVRCACVFACGMLQVCGCMMVFILFSCASFFTNGGNAAPAILFFITLPLVIAFWAVCYRRYCRNNRTPPLTLLAAEPSGAPSTAALLLLPASGLASCMSMHAVVALNQLGSTCLPAAPASEHSSPTNSLAVARCAACTRVQALACRLPRMCTAPPRCGQVLGAGIPNQARCGSAMASPSLCCERVWAGSQNAR